MSLVHSNNFITIQGWMVTELNLKGNELLVYAIIYGFSQSGEGQRYIGSLQYLADWTNSTKQGIMKNLKSLVEKGLISKEEQFKNGVKFCEYYATEFNTPLNNVSQGIKQSLTQPGKQSLTNNIDSFNNINHIIGINNIDTKTPKPNKRVQLHKHGEYQHVLLTDEEYKKLCDEYGTPMASKAVIFLDEYIEMKGYKAKNHYLAIRKWVIDAVKEHEAKSRQRNSTQSAQHEGRLDWIDDIPPIGGFGG